VPKYHHAKGIVRKCDMDSGLRGEGRLVQACPMRRLHRAGENSSGARATRTINSLACIDPSSAHDALSQATARDVQPPVHQHSSAQPHAVVLMLVLTPSIACSSAEGLR
jgi:hypothetical protein